MALFKKNFIAQSEKVGGVVTKNKNNLKEKHWRQMENSYPIYCTMKISP